MSDTRPGGTLAWQYRHYPEFHGDRRNLVIHVLTVPLFQWGSLLLTAPLWGPWWLVFVGLGSMVTAMALQGRGHGLEKNPPVPFAGPLDVLVRIFAEQWLAFPRWFITGGLSEAWRRSGPSTSRR